MSGAANMYRVGDCVYFEESSSGPYNIRRIEELSKNAAGNVEARVAVFFRRRDVSSALLKIADQAERRFDEFYEDGKSKPDGYGSSGHTIANGAKDEVKVEVVEGNGEKKEKEDDGKFDWGYAGLPSGAEALSTEERLRLRKREVFLSRQIETLPATQIRGKCSVTLLSEIETPECYNKDDAFFYSLVYDPQQMSLLADKGAIRVGEKYQAEVPPFKDPEIKEEEGDDDDNKENGNGDHLVIADDEDEPMPDAAEVKQESVVDETEREAVVYHPYHNLSEREIDQFLIIARSVGTFSRALDTSSSTKLPSLHMTAAAASRDVTILHAMALLHQANYDLAMGMKYLVPPPSKAHYPLEVDKAAGHNTINLGGPILIRDQIEEWSASEANLFEEALEKYGKDFSDIRNDFLPWKAMRNIVEYYYMWKTTNRYIDGRRKKMTEEKEAKLKQVYIPNHNKPCANLIGQLNSTGNAVPGTSACEGCMTLESPNWYAWGPAALQLRLCDLCWKSWKRNGGLALTHEYERYDLEGGADVTIVDKGQTISNVNPLAINRTSAAAQNRVGGSGQVVARLPPNHPQFAAASLAQSQPNNQKRPTFNMRSNLFTRVVRKMTPKSVMNIRKQARRPFLEVPTEAVRQYVNTVESSKLIHYVKIIVGNTIPKAFGQYVMEHARMQSPAARRPASGPAVGEPPAKRMALPIPPSSTSSVPTVATTIRSSNVVSRDAMFNFRAGRQFRLLRKESLTRKQRRRLSRIPMKGWDFVEEPLQRLLQLTQK